MPLPAFLSAGYGGGLIAGVASGIGNLISGSIGANKQYHANKRLAAFQHAQNMELMKYQLQYNSPESQMQRFKAAGLNPNLVYGQGTPGNLEGAPRYPDIKAPDLQSMYADAGSKFQQATLQSVQAGLISQKTEESGIKQDLMRAQKNLINANPYLNQRYVDAMVINLESIAKLKEQEAGFMTSKMQDDITGARWERGYLKMQREIDLLTQKYNLTTSDQKIKAKIIESKEFENAIKEIQKDWLKNGDMTPQHIYQGILLLLSKML